ncbi:hypothetical protein LMG27952_02622 [Paraburkholderia hiiakae]|uniref:Uncharacterized protein n=1 Tax=Paraburkholderia hiiakae TaxID=1081782 RepID=A0ABM8NLM7_9BURK|nr:hypothetical protein [Paraburkholderia hiiakae]CAD6531790.1 hypothetical protein LMG27952_02622 [Paraburkholderia hiiakae]
MSRSRRTTPIFGHTTVESERGDKKRWHQRFRAHERATLASAAPDALADHVTLLRNEAGNVWSMGKDGKSWWAPGHRVLTAERIARELGCTPRERATLKKRLLRRWMAK